jgi:hypothetical protein
MNEKMRKNLLILINFSSYTFKKPFGISFGLALMNIRNNISLLYLNEFLYIITYARFSIRTQFKAFIAFTMI